MCFRFDAWCCFGAVPDPEDNYCVYSAKGSVPPPYAVPPKTTTTTTHYTPAPAAQLNGHHHYGHPGVAAAHHANGHRAPHHNHHQLPVAAAAEEEDRKVSNHARRGYATAPAAAATKGSNGYAAGAQEKAYVYSRADGTLKHPATKAMIADGAGHGAHYNNYHYELEPAHKEYYHYH